VAKTKTTEETTTSGIKTSVTTITRTETREMANVITTLM